MNLLYKNNKIMFLGVLFIFVSALQLAHGQPLSWITRTNEIRVSASTGHFVQLPGPGLFPPSISASDLDQCYDECVVRYKVSQIWLVQLKNANECECYQWAEPPQLMPADQAPDPALGISASASTSVAYVPAAESCMNVDNELVQGSCYRLVDANSVLNQQRCLAACEAEQSVPPRFLSPGLYTALTTRFNLDPTVTDFLMDWTETSIGSEMMVSSDCALDLCGNTNAFFGNVPRDPVRSSAEVNHIDYLDTGVAWRDPNSQQFLNRVCVCERFGDLNPGLQYSNLPAACAVENDPRGGCCAISETEWNSQPRYDPYTPVAVCANTTQENEEFPVFFDDEFCRLGNPNNRSRWYLCRDNKQCFGDICYDEVSPAGTVCEDEVADDVFCLPDQPCQINNATGIRTCDGAVPLLTIQRDLVSGQTCGLFFNNGTLRQCLAGLTCNNGVCESEVAFVGLGNRCGEVIRDVLTYECAAPGSTCNLDTRTCTIVRNIAVNSPCIPSEDRCAAGLYCNVQIRSCVPYSEGFTDYVIINAICGTILAIESIVFILFCARGIKSQRDITKIQKSL